MAKSRQGGYESSSKPAEELCTPPRGPAPGAGKVTNNLAPIRINPDEVAHPAGTFSPGVPAGSNSAARCDVDDHQGGEASASAGMPPPTDVSDTRAAAGLCAGPPDPTTEREGTGRPSAPTLRGSV